MHLAFFFYQDIIEKQFKFNEYKIQYRLNYLTTERKQMCYTASVQKQTNSKQMKQIGSLLQLKINYQHALYTLSQDLFLSIF